jgi:hypothetical protein
MHGVSPRPFEMIITDESGKYTPLQRHIRPSAPREWRINHLRRYFLQYLVEDGQDGTRFDCAVLDALDRLEAEYPESGSGLKKQA